MKSYISSLVLYLHCSVISCCTMITQFLLRVKTYVSLFLHNQVKNSGPFQLIVRILSSKIVLVSYLLTINTPSVEYCTDVICIWLCACRLVIHPSTKNNKNFSQRRRKK